MKQIVVKLTAQSPIAVGEWMTSRSNVRESLAYIPGGVLRGALAQACANISADTHPADAHSATATPR